MAETQLILQTLVKGTESATKALNTVKGSLDGINKSAETASKGTKKFTDKLNENKEGFQALGIGAGIVTAGLVVGINKATGEAVKLQNSMIGLRSIVEGTGGDFKKAEKFINEFTADGLVPVGDAATSLKNLLSRGFGLEEASQIMLRFKDSAAFGRQASLGLGEAIKGATEGLKNENSILVDNAGVTKNVYMMWEEYAKAHGITVKAMDLSQKRQAELNGIMDETKFQVGDAAKLSDTYAGSLARQEAASIKLQQTIGTALMPAMTILKETITAIITPITEWTQKHPELTAGILLTTVAVAGITAGIVALGFAIGPLIAGVKALGVALMFLTTNPIGLTITAIAALVAGGVLLYQNWDYVKQKASELSAWLVELYNRYGALLGPIKTIIDTGVLLYQNWDTIKSKASELGSALSGTWTAIKNQVIIVFDEIYNYAVGKIQGIIDFAMSAVNLIQKAINKAVSMASELSGKASSFISSSVNAISGKKADGGTVNGGRTYLVGEEGPELFRPGMTGQIIPNNKLGTSNGGVVINFTGTFGQGVAQEIGKMIVTQLKQASYI